MDEAESFLRSIVNFVFKFEDANQFKNPMSKIERLKKANVSHALHAQNVLAFYGHQSFKNWWFNLVGILKFKNKMYY